MVTILRQLVKAFLLRFCLFRQKKNERKCLELSAPITKIWKLICLCLFNEFYELNSIMRPQTSLILILLILVLNYIDLNSTVFCCFLSSSTWYFTHVTCHNFFKLLTIVAYLFHRRFYVPDDQLVAHSFLRTTANARLFE